MSTGLRVELLEHRVPGLPTAVVAIIQHLGIEHDVARVERARLEEIRLAGGPEAPSERLMSLYGKEHS